MNSWWTNNSSTADTPSLKEMRKLIDSLPPTPPPFAMSRPMAIVPESIDPEVFRGMMLKAAEGLPDFDIRKITEMPIQQDKHLEVQDHVFFVERPDTQKFFEIQELKYIELPAKANKKIARRTWKQINRLENARDRKSLGDRGQRRLAKLWKKLERSDHIDMMIWEYKRTMRKACQAMSIPRHIIDPGYKSYSTLSCGA